MSAFLDQIRWNADGLAPVVAAEARTGRLLMHAWLNREALSAALAENRAVYWSRSRERLWRKGERSGNVQELVDVYLDCDDDTVCYRVRQRGGGACHTGRGSCFFQRLEGGEWRTAEASAPGGGADGARDVLAELAGVIERRKGADPKESYVAGLHEKGLDAILQKVGEEAVETILAAKGFGGGDGGAVLRETADLWFHSMVMLSRLGLAPARVLEELENRFNMSGLEEKASRGRSSERG